MHRQFRTVLLVTVVFTVLCPRSVESLFGWFEAKMEKEKELLTASIDGDSNAVMKLLEGGVKPDTFYNDDGSSCLLMASENGHTDIVFMLLDNDAKVDYQRKDGASALIASSASGHLDVVNLLCHNKATVDLQDENGTTALMFAAHIGSPDVVRLLLQSGANPDHQNKDGKTALMWASFHGHTQVVRDLIDSNASPQLEDADGFNFINIIELDLQGGWSASQEQKEASAQLLDFFELLRKGEYVPVEENGVAEGEGKSEL